MMSKTKQEAYRKIEEDAIGLIDKLIDDPNEILTREDIFLSLAYFIGRSIGRHNEYTEYKSYELTQSFQKGVDIGLSESSIGDF